MELKRGLRSQRRWGKSKELELSSSEKVSSFLEKGLQSLPCSETHVPAKWDLSQ